MYPMQQPPPPPQPWYPPPRQPQWYPPPPPARAPGTFTGAQAAMIIGGIFLAFTILAVVSALVRGPHTDADGGNITYAVNGVTRGEVHFDEGVRRSDAAILFEYLKETGWFVPASGARTAVSGKAWGSYGYGSPGRGRGDPVANIAHRANNGFEVIVYTSKANADSTDVQEWGARAAQELRKRLGGRPVRFVIRSETVVGRGVEWTDVYFD